MSGFCRFQVMFLFISLALLTSVWGRSVNNGRRKPPVCALFHFYDEVTEMCEHCRDICDHAEVWDTEEQCQKDCQDYVRAQQCTEQEYYDEQIAACSPCQELCQHHAVRGTTAQCLDRCPYYNKPQTEDVPMLGDSDLSTPSSPPEKKPLIHNTAASESRHLIWIIPFVSALMLLLAITLAVAFTICRKTQTRVPVVKFQPPSGTETQDGSQPGIAEESVLLRYPETETQPGVNSRLVTSGT